MGSPQPNCLFTDGQWRKWMGLVSIHFTPILVPEFDNLELLDLFCRENQTFGKS
ncbi:hypothetical protein SAMN05216388_10625 [Halorientalis persicus]|uniref:Uncharacterized protein n=1 Tax=Halorientalis persicus TaxID=1367881 RepID=A0A1H8WJR5_9EURY|nr:hypothetical protein SAMN05216388_10625 [Halorientalis persicus]